MLLRIFLDWFFITFAKLEKFFKHMIQWATVAMLFMGSLLPGFSSQLNKLPSLINHYRHHVEEHGNIGVAEFIAMHYNENSSHREEEDHQDLPFFQMSTTSLVALTDAFFTYSPELPSQSVLELGYYKPCHYSFQDCGSIFQPPKVA
jgi:hypothetical protein